MRKVMPRKRALVQAGNEAADRLVSRVAHCEWCQESYGNLAQHEIANASWRQACRTESYGVLVLCNPCHVQLHRMPKPEQQHIGLAILYHVRTSDYDLKAFNLLVNPNAPNRITQHEVDQWIKRLLVVSRPR